MNHVERIEAVRNLLVELSQMQVTTALCVSQLQDLVATDSAVDGVPTGDVPRVDESSFSVLWKNRKCYLGHTTSFRLFARLLRRANGYLSYAQLEWDVWEGHVRSDDTVRSAVRQLKLKLCAAGMRRLALKIRGQGGHYGLILKRP